MKNLCVTNLDIRQYACDLCLDIFHFRLRLYWQALIGGAIANDKIFWRLLFADPHGLRISVRMCEALQISYYSERQIFFNVHYNIIMRTS